MTPLEGAALLNIIEKPPTQIFYFPLSCGENYCVFVNEADWTFNTSQQKYQSEMWYEPSTQNRLC